MTLDELGKLYGTDKYHIHKFTSIYDEHFKNIRDNNIKLLEIGVFYGSSLKMWEQYFKNGIIYGADIFSEKERDELKGGKEFRHLLIFDNTRTKIFQTNQENVQELKLLPNELDIIIDDGGHTMYQQQLTFKTLFWNLVQGGTYILEDLHTSRYPNYGATDNNNTLQLLKDLQQKNQSCNGYYLTNDEFSILSDNIAQIKIYENSYDSITSIIQKV